MFRRNSMMWKRFQELFINRFQNICFKKGLKDMSLLWRDSMIHFYEEKRFQDMFLWGLSRKVFLNRFHDFWKDSRTHLQRDSRHKSKTVVLQLWDSGNITAAKTILFFQKSEKMIVLNNLISLIITTAGDAPLGDGGAKKMVSYIVVVHILMSAHLRPLGL